MRFQSPEALLGFNHRGGGPAHRHGRRAPVFDVSADVVAPCRESMMFVQAGERWSSRVAIHCLMRAADSATKRRKVADFDRPAPAGPARRPPGQAHQPLEFAPRGDGDQHLVHRPFAEPILPDRALPTRQDAFLAVEAANVRTLDIDLAAAKADLALRPPHRCACRPSPRAWREPQIASASCSIVSPSVSMPAARQNRSKLALMPASASLFKALVGIAVDVIAFFMALLSFSWISPCVRRTHLIETRARLRRLTIPTG